MGAAAGVYVFLTENIDDVVPAFLTVWGLAYLALIGLAGMLLVVLEVRFWRGPVYQRPSFAYRVLFTRRNRKVPTRLEILERARLRDQLLTVAFGVLGSAFLGPGAFLAISEGLEGGFPVERWSTIWFAGTLAIAVTLSIVLLIGINRGRGHLAARRRRRCHSCGMVCPKEARVCATCSEPSLSWHLLRPPDETR